MTDPRWLLLAHQLPARLSNARVKTWRRLQHLGAVPARNSVYVLPNTEQCREDFEWIRSEIVALGGEASVFTADAISQGAAEDIMTAFQRSRNDEYRALKRDADRLLPLARRKGTRGTSRGQHAGRAVRALRERFDAIDRIDFFRAAARAEAAAALAAVEQVVERRPRVTAPLPARLAAEDFQNRRWATRPRPGVDRMASAWLIRRYIDPRATFAFVDRASDGDVPFDMYSGEFTHHGDSCTYEVFVERFGISDPVVARLGQIVHDLDMKDAKYGAAEAPTVGRMVEGLRGLHADDAVLLEQGIAMFEALARSFQLTDGVPAAGRTKRSPRQMADRRRRDSSARR